MQNIYKTTSTKVSASIDKRTNALVLACLFLLFVLEQLNGSKNAPILQKCTGQNGHFSLKISKKILRFQSRDPPLIVFTLTLVK